jgi:hypothetical protein
MTSSKRLRAGLLALSLQAAGPLWAGLGEPQSSIATDRARISARHAVARMPQYTVHDLTMADGSRLQQYVAGNGQVFAVRWDTLHKPDLTSLLGQAFASYAGAAQQAARRGGIQRHFHHEGTDLVVQASGHLHVFSGYAYRPSLLPQGLSPQALGLG